jgi:hypothetical protein
MKMLKHAIVGVAAGLALSAHACVVREFGAENLLNFRQNTPAIDFQEMEAFAAGAFPTQPIFTGNEPQFGDLSAPIELAGFGYAVIHYAPGTSGNPTVNRGGTLDFYLIRGAGSCQFIFPQTGPGDNLSNGRITSVTLFLSEPIPDAGATVVLFALALSGLGVIHRFAMPIHYSKNFGAFTTYSGQTCRKSTKNTGDLRQTFAKVRQTSARAIRVKSVTRVSRRQHELLPHLLSAKGS